MKKNFKLTTLHINIIAFLFPLVALFKRLLKLFGRKTAVLWINLVLLLFVNFPTYMSIYSSHIFSACSLIPKYILSFSLVLIYALCVYYLVYLALHLDSFIHIVLLFLFGYQALTDSWLSCSFSLTLAYAISLAQFLWEIVFKSHFYY